jgi:hypothetical protein
MYAHFEKRITGEVDSEGPFGSVTFKGGAIYGDQEPIAAYSPMMGQWRRHPRLTELVGDAATVSNPNDLLYDIVRVDDEEPCVG